MGARLGQHFLIHSWAARALAHAAAPLPGETILEIGPGKGILTKELLALGRVVAIEKDPILVEHLKRTFSEEIAGGRLRLIESDVRDVSPKMLGLDSARYVLAANIPYYITGEIIRTFLSASERPRTMALLIQKEVAQRIVDRKGSILSLSVKAFGVPRIEAKVPKKHFSPQPSVDSAILVIGSIRNPFTSLQEERHFFDLLHVGFASKRKLLSNNLSAKFTKERVVSALLASGVPKEARAENLSLEQWKQLAKLLQ